MHQQHFNQLLKAICDVAAIPQWQQVCEHRTLRLRDQLVHLHFDEATDSRRLYAYVDLGEEPVVNHAVASRLLQLNCTPGAWILGHFGVHEESGRPLYVASLRSEGLVDEARVVVDWLGHLVRPLTELKRRHGQLTEFHP